MMEKALPISMMEHLARPKVTLFLVKHTVHGARVKLGDDCEGG